MKKVMIFGEYVSVEWMRRVLLQSDEVAQLLPDENKIQYVIAYDLDDGYWIIWKAVLDNENRVIEKEIVSNYGDIIVIDEYINMVRAFPSYRGAIARLIGIFQNHIQRLEANLELCNVGINALQIAINDENDR